jgi:hypothetical protein
MRDDIIDHLAGGKICELSIQTTIWVCFVRFGEHNGWGIRRGGGDALVLARIDSL